MHNSMSPQGISSILLSVLLASAAILTVFITLGSRVEKRVVQRQTSFVIQEILKDAPLLGDAEAPITAYINGLKVPDMQAEDAACRASNAALVRKAALMVGGCLIAGLLGVRMWARRAGFSFRQVVKEALVSCMLAAGTEAAFLLLVAQHFISADPQAVRLMILEALQKDAA